MGTKGAYLLLELGAEWFGLDVEQVEAVLPYRELSRSPFQREPTLGATVYRGDFMGVAHLGALLGVECAPEAAHTVIVVLRWGEALVGLAAERSQGLLGRDEEIEPFEQAGAPAPGKCIERSMRCTERSRVLHVIDKEALLDELAARLEEVA